jgi:hypothetical protein
MTTPAVNETVQRRLWLTAGWLSIAYVVVTFAVSPAYTSVVTGLGGPRIIKKKALVASSMTTGFAGAYGELVAVLVFLVGGSLMAQLLRGDGVVASWLASCMAGAAVTYVAIVIATGAATAAALYNGHHGVSVDAITPVAAIGNFGFSLSGAAAGVFVLASSAAGQVSRLLPRWFTVIGYVVGVACLTAVLAARSGAPQMMLWYLWLVGFGVLALRRTRRAAPAPSAVAVGTPA